jgi:ankyrin repeat protein/8-oxo-dGTP pyrophosphatase MutT (NUDIX family)
MLKPTTTFIPADLALETAAASGEVDRVRRLVRSGGVDVNADNGKALRSASQNGYLEIVKLLVERGADVHAGNDGALREACKDLEELLDIVEYLLDAGADVHAEGDEALRSASKNGHLQVMRLLVERGADVHAGNDRALREACKDVDERTDIVQLLLEAGADVHAEDDEALRWASLGGHLDVVTLLLAAGADVHAADDEALRNAAAEGSTFVVSVLLDAGSDVHAAYDEALRIAVSNDHNDVVDILLNAGADVHALDDDALFVASTNGNAMIVNLLLNAGADVHALDDDALRTASGAGYTEVVERLLQAGADVHALDDEALRMACEHNHVECVRLLLDAGADADNEEAITLAVMNNHIECVRLLLDAGANVSPDVINLAVGFTEMVTLLGGWGDDEFPAIGRPVVGPADPRTCTLEAQLGGTTGATLVRCGGALYVRKSVPLEVGVVLYNEYLANRIYDLLGVPVPACWFYETPCKCVLLSEYLSPSEALTRTSPAIQELQENFAVDAFLANWDVLGQSMDNVLVYQGTPVRIDMGGAMYRRAQGTLKTPEEFSFQVVELYTMRCMSSSFTSPHCEVFAPLTDVQVAEQIRRIAPRVRADVLPQVEFLPELHSVLEGRIAMMEQWSKTRNRALTQVRTPLPGTESLVTRDGYDTLFKVQTDYIRRLKNQRKDLFDALRSYVEEDYYSEFNRQLCTGVLTTKAQQLNESLTTAFLGLPPIPIDILVYRGLPTKVDPARLGCQYVSTSTSKSAAKEFMQGATCCLLQITLPAGVRAFPMRSVGTTMSNEYEVLLPPGGQWVQRSASSDKGVTVYNYDYIPPGPKYTIDSQPVFAGMYIVYEGRLLVHKRSARLGGFLSCPGGSIEPRESPKKAAEREAFEEAGVLVSPRVRAFYKSPDGKFVGFVDRDTIRPAVLGPNEYSLSELDMTYDFKDVPGAEVVPGTGHAWVPLKELYASVTRGPIPHAQQYFIGAVQTLLLPTPTYVDIYVVYNGKLLVHKEVRSGFLYTSNGPIFPKEDQEDAAVRVAAGHAGVKISGPFSQVYLMLKGELVGLVYTATKRPKVRGPSERYVKEVDMEYGFFEFPTAEVVDGTGHAWIPLEDLYEYLKIIPKTEVSGAFVSAVKKLTSP